jgi:CBS domain-containing protein
MEAIMLMPYKKELTLEDAARHIINGHERTLVFHDAKMKLIGVITQGDILRAIWNGTSALSPIQEFINYNPIVIELNQVNKKEIAVQLFIEDGVLVIPVVDDSKLIHEVLRVREILSAKES